LLILLAFIAWSHPVSRVESVSKTGVVVRPPWGANPTLSAIDFKELNTCFEASSLTLRDLKLAHGWRVQTVSGLLSLKFQHFEIAERVHSFP
jgi:hypothetical protein